MVHTYILVHSWEPKTRISAQFADRLYNQSLVSSDGQAIAFVVLCEVPPSLYWFVTIMTIFFLQDKENNNHKLLSWETSHKRQ